MFTHQQGNITHISGMTDSLAHVPVFSAHPLNAAVLLGTILSGNIAGSSKTWQKYEWFQTG